MKLTLAPGSDPKNFIFTCQIRRLNAKIQSRVKQAMRLSAIVLVLLCTATTSLQAPASLAAATRAATNEYFRHIMFRESPYAEYRGIHPVAIQQGESLRAPDFAHYAISRDAEGRVHES